MEYFTKEQWKILIILGGCNFILGIVYSLQAPFYPAEAERQGASTTFAGVVLGIYEFAGFVVCPLISSMLLPRLGFYRCFHFGFLVTGTATLLFGFLNRLTDTATFVSLSLLLRIMESIGGATTYVSSYGFLNSAFPKSIATAVGVMETLFAVGMGAGPPLGEAIYQLGGGSELWSFTLPFLTIGLIIYTVIILTAYMLWPMRKVTNENKDNNNLANGRRESKEEDSSVVFRPIEEIQHGGRKAGIIALLKIPSIFVFYLSVMAVTISYGVITCTLEPYLRAQFHLTPIQTGGMFFCFGGFYAGFSPIWGLICDRIQRPILVTLTGCLLSIFAFTFMGPSILIPLQPSLGLIGVSLASFGLAMGATYVSTFSLMLNEAKRQGFPDSSSLSGSIAALWMSGMYLGSSFGPIVAGALFEKFGFGVETLLPVVLFGVSLILLLFVLGLTPSSSPPGIIHQSETTSLLQTSVPIYYAGKQSTVTTYRCHDRR